MSDIADFGGIGRDRPCVGSLIAEIMVLRVPTPGRNMAEVKVRAEHKGGPAGLGARLTSFDIRLVIRVEEEL